MKDYMLVTSNANVLAEADKMKAMYDKYLKQFESARYSYLTYKARDAAYDDKHIWFYRVKSMDAAGRTTALTYGNGLSTYKTYDNSNGQLDTIVTGVNGAASVQHLSYKYDANDNVTSRHNKRLNISEYFSYDRMNRLYGSSVRGKFNGIAYNSGKSYRYHAHGGLRFMTGNGSYTYNNNAHRPQRISGESYAYDANGNMRGSKGRSYQWTSFNKISSISKNGRSVNYQYDAGRARFKKTGFNGNGNFVEHIYIGKLYEREQTAGTGIVKHKHFIYLPNGQLAAVHVKSTHNGQARPDETRYMHRDNLGSIDTITDGRGNVVERMSFEAFGKRRAGNWRALDRNGGVQFASFTKRGFTGHEHIDEFRLINMNGRIYDPELGIFLSADPTVQLPHTPMSYNRYAYAGNNPLKYVDLDGYGLFDVLDDIWNSIKEGAKKIERWVKENWRVIVAVAAIIITSGAAAWWAAGLLGYSSAAAAMLGGTLGSAMIVGGVAGAVGGFVGSIIMTGDLRTAFKSALVGGIMGAAFGGIGYKFAQIATYSNSVTGLPDLSAGQRVMKVLTQSTVSGVGAELQGMKFRKAFESGALLFALGETANYMRWRMLEQSKKNPMNIGGRSTSHDGQKVGGARYNEDTGLTQDSIAGGEQGKTKGNFFGYKYDITTGKVVDISMDKLVEAYAGPHDFLNSWAYTDMGNNQVLSQPLYTISSIGNVVNIGTATPLVVSNTIQDYAPSLLYDEYRE